MIELNKIYHGYCEDIMKDIPDKSIDLIITDPPYILDQSKPGKTTTINSVQKYSDEKYTNITDGFNIEDILSEFKRVLKKFNLFIFCSNKQISDLMKWGELQGYYTTCLVWHKNNSTPFANGVWRQDLEFIVHMREKGAVFQGNCEQKKKLTIIPNAPSKYGHPTEKPLKLIKKYIQIGSNENDLILDPYVGSGTAAVACHDLKRNFIGIEKEKVHYDAACKRYEEKKAQLSLF